MSEEILNTSETEIDNEETILDNELEVNEKENDELDTEETDDELDNLFDDDNSEYNVAGYDLSKYKDALNFEDEAIINEFEQYIEKYKNAGFSQEQIEFLIDDEISEMRNKKESKLTKTQIKTRLQNSLTKEEIRNYKPTYSFVKDIVNGTEFDDKLGDIMMNPTLVKLFHSAYKKSLGSTINMKSISKRPEKQIKSISIDEAYDKLLNATKDSNIDKESLIKELKSSVSDTQGLNELLSIFGK